jgi:hypothetical protein
MVALRTASYSTEHGARSTERKIRRQEPRDRREKEGNRSGGAVEYWKNGEKEKTEYSRQKPGGRRRPPPATAC